MKDVHPIALGAGAAVIVGSFFLFNRTKKKCTEFPSLYKEVGDDGGLPMTDKAQDDAIYYARQIVRSNIYADEPVLPAAIQLQVARKLEKKCDWTNLKTDIQKAVYEAIGKIVTRVVIDAKEDPEFFLSTFE